MALPPSTANWHWKTKHVTPWARQWFEQQLTGLTVKGEGEELVKIEKITDVDGDVELGQRKSKLITIYDCRVDLKWSGTASDGTDVSGSLNIPEVSHENTVDGLSDYVFSWTLDTDPSDSVNALFNLAKTRLPSMIKDKFAEFPSALIETHGKDLTISGEPSRSTTPQVPGVASAPAAASTTDQKVNKEKPVSKTKGINTETVEISASLQASADDLFGILTDEKRIPHWSRAPAQSMAKVGTDYSLFGGGVKGTYTSLTPGKEIIQTWSLNSPTWPLGHVGILTTKLDQSSDSTKLVLTLTGVPKGLEDETRRNLEGYYVGGLKSIGYVQLVPAPPPPPYSTTSHSLSSFRSRKPSADDPQTSMTMRILSVFIVFLAIGAAIMVPWMTLR